jgi:type II secretory pathway component GspD/PulD (secretin)
VNFVIGADVYAGGGPPPITLSGRMKLRTVLNWITQITDLRMSIRDQAIFLSSEDTEGETTLRIYNVTDLLSPVQDFPGPELAYNAGDADGGGFDLFGGGGFDDGDAGLDIDQVVEFIETSVAPDSWGDPGVAITIRQGGTLFITQVPRVHALVDELLRRLRQQQSLQVNVRIRLLDVTKSFIEEIGFEWQDLSTVDQGGILSSSTQNGFSRITNTGSVTANTNNILPGNSLSQVFQTANSGLRLESAWNLTNTFNSPQLNVVLEAMEQEADSTILNSPELTTFNGQRANAQFIRQYAYISDYSVETGGGAGTFDPVISVLNFGDIIDIRPLVSADRKYVTLEVRPSSVTLQGVFPEVIRAVTTVANVVIPLEYPIELPNVEVRTLRTTVMLPDKGSLMLGGYVGGLRQRTHTGIPFLSHIPYLGRLFSKNGLYDENRHLMFLVTVNILDIAEIEAMQ